MISPEKAQALIDAGVGWGVEFTTMNGYKLPPLSQLLAEIEARGYELEMRQTANYARLEIWMGYRAPDKQAYVFYADALDDVAADALLWILKEGVSNNEATDNI